MAPLPAASAASRCSRPRISTSRRSGRARCRSRLTSTGSQEKSRDHSRVTCCAAAALSSFPQHRLQVACQPGAPPGLALGKPVAAPACDAVAEGSPQAGQGLRGRRPIGHAFYVAQQLPRVLSPMRGPLVSRAPGRGGKRK